MVFTNFKPYNCVVHSFLDNLLKDKKTNSSDTKGSNSLTTCQKIESFHSKDSINKERITAITGKANEEKIFCNADDDKTQTRHLMSTLAKKIITDTLKSTDTKPDNHLPLNSTTTTTTTGQANTMDYTSSVTTKEASSNFKKQKNRRNGGHARHRKPNTFFASNVTITSNNDMKSLQESQVYDGTIDKTACSDVPSTKTLKKQSRKKDKTEGNVAGGGQFNKTKKNCKSQAETNTLQETHKDDLTKTVENESSSIPETNHKATTDNFNKISYDTNRYKYSRARRER
jgi:hypothetical protein